MKARIREKDESKVIDQLQGELEEVISDAAAKYFLTKKVKDAKLRGYVSADIFSGALITVFTRHLAYLSAHEEGFDHHTYLQGIFESIAILFKKCRDHFTEVLKDKDLKKSDKLN